MPTIMQFSASQSYDNKKKKDWYCLLYGMIKLVIQIIFIFLSLVKVFYLVWTKLIEFNLIINLILRNYYMYIHLGETI